MMIGRVIAVVGPSGVGKDCVMADLAQACPDLQIVHRAIALTSGLGAEDHLFVTVTEFFRVAEQGAFCLHWTATV